jgi:hypothetical protein
MSSASEAVPGIERCRDCVAVAAAFEGGMEPLGGWV